MAEGIKSERKHGLVGWPMIFFWLAMIIFASHASTHMVAAGDTWVAMACGRHFINHGVNTVEPFSFNSHRAGPTPETMRAFAQQLRGSVSGQRGLTASLSRWWADKAENFEHWPQWQQSFTKWIHPTGWVNQNWLTHVFFYWLTHLSPVADAANYSFNTLVYWKFAIYILTVITLFYAAKVLGANPALSAVFACFAMFVGRSFIDIRPAGFSNLLIGVNLLVFALATYRNILYIWLLVPMIVLWCNLHGGYIYAFVVLVPFTGLHLFASVFPKNFVTIGRKGVYHTIAAGITAFIAMVLFNPFHLTNLTHTFVISISKHAELWRTVNEWHPAFEWKNPVGTGVPFLIMFILAWILLLFWAVAWLKKPAISAKAARHKKEPSPESYQWPKIDIAIIAVAAFTVYMAVVSRRFIPIAAIAAAPVLAMLADQIIKMFGAAYNFKKKNTLTISPMPQSVRVVISGIAVAAVLFFGTWWSYRFHQVYLGPSIDDTEFTSVFMRMSASQVKPFKACQFLRDNKISGKMFNYWTEGGFIAYGQIPDPNTGKPPLQLFIDGRAQAAYEPEKYKTWIEIISGGRPAQMAHLAGRPYNSADYRDIAKWLEVVLRKYNIWVALMPQPEFDSEFVMGLDRSENWRLAYADDYQKFFVDIKTPRGDELYRGLYDGNTIFPDKFSKCCTLSSNMLRMKAEELIAQGLDLAIEAFNERPSSVPMATIIDYGRYHSELREKVASFCKAYYDDFLVNKKLYARMNGYAGYMVAARWAAGYLAEVYSDDPKAVESYRNNLKEFDREAAAIVNRSRW